MSRTTQWFGGFCPEKSTDEVKTVGPDQNAIMAQDADEQVANFPKLRQVVPRSEPCLLEQIGKGGSLGAPAVWGAVTDQVMIEDDSVAGVTELAGKLARVR